MTTVSAKQALSPAININNKLTTPPPSSSSYLSKMTQALNITQLVFIKNCTPLKAVPGIFNYLFLSLKREVIIYTKLGEKLEVFLYVRVMFVLSIACLKLLCVFSDCTCSG